MAAKSQRGTLPTSSWPNHAADLTGSGSLWQRFEAERHPEDPGTKFLTTPLVG